MTQTSELIDDADDAELGAAVQDALRAKSEWTTLAVTQLDHRRLDAAKRDAGRTDDSYRQFILYLIESHPEIDSGAIEEDAVRTFVEHVSEESETTQD